MSDTFPDLNLLQTFLKVVDENGFGRAARSLDVSQSYVSQQIKRLEDKLGHVLIVRAGNTIRLTPDGEALVIFARSMGAVADKVRHYFARPRSAGLLRIGMTGDFVRTAMPDVLRLFSRSHPNYQIEIEASLSSRQLLRLLDEGQLDLVVGKDVAGRTRGEVLWQAPLIWAGAPERRGPIEDPVPLVVPTAPSEGRDIVIAALNDAGRSWRIDFQSASTSSLEAAVKGGVGVVAVIPEMALAAGTHELGPDAGLPQLPDVSFFLDRRPDADDPGIHAFEAVLREVVRLISRPAPPVALVDEDGDGPPSHNA